MPQMAGSAAPQGSDYTKAWEEYFKKQGQFLLLFAKWSFSLVAVMITLWYWIDVLITYFWAASYFFIIKFSISPNIKYFNSLTSSSLALLSLNTNN